MKASRIPPCPRPFLLLVPLSLSFCGPPPGADRRPIPASPGHVKVMTFNVNYGGVDPARTAAAIRRSGADLVALQETNRRWERALRRLLSYRYPHQEYHHAPAAGGLAFLSRWPLHRLSLSGPPAGGWFAAWHAEVRTPFGRLHLLNVHLRPPVGETGRTSTIPSAYLSTRPLREAEMAHHLAGIPTGGAVVVLGDFNEGDRGRAVALLLGRGFASALAQGDPATATWQWRTSYGTLRTRLDHILYRGLKLRGAQVLPDAASDHFPVEAVFAFR